MCAWQRDSQLCCFIRSMGLLAYDLCNNVAYKHTLQPPRVLNSSTGLPQRHVSVAIGPLQTCKPSATLSGTSYPLVCNPYIRRRLLAETSNSAAAVALATSVTNIAMLTVMPNQSVWLCLGSCSIDVRITTSNLCSNLHAPSSRLRSMPSLFSG